MDPNAALVKIRDNVKTYQETDDAETANDAADRVVEAVAYLDQWLSRGGFLPASWRKRS